MVISYLLVNFFIAAIWGDLFNERSDWIPLMAINGNIFWYFGGVNFRLNYWLIKLVHRSVNPARRIDIHWSCLPYSPSKELGTARGTKFAGSYRSEPTKSLWLALWFAIWLWYELKCLLLCAPADKLLHDDIFQFSLWDLVSDP